MVWGAGRPREAPPPRREMPRRGAALRRPQSHGVKSAAAAAGPSHLFGLGEHVGDLQGQGGQWHERSHMSWRHGSHGLSPRQWPQLLVCIHCR